MTVTVRFAPSPTGLLHVGNARVALVNWLFARREMLEGGEGAFVLRIDDTDRARSTAEFDAAIQEDLTWLGLSWSKLVRQSDRTALYVELADRCGVAPTRGWERIRPALPTPDQRRVLDIPADQPLFSIERVASHADVPIEWRNSVVRGDLYAFVARWEGGQAVATRLEAER